MIFLTENLGTILTGLVLLGIVAGIILKIHRDRKNNPSGCCGSCSRCAGCCTVNFNSTFQL